MTLCRKAHLVIGLVCGSVLLALPCFAADGVGFNRQTYDLVMRVVNFAILAYIIYRYGKDPLKDFLASKRASVVLSFEQIDEQKEEIARQHEEQNTLLAQMDQKIDSIRNYYHRLAQDEKEKIMARANATRDHILKDGQERADREFEKGKAEFRKDVVELAIQLAEQRIRQEITTTDNENLVQDYLGQLSSVAKS